MDDTDEAELASATAGDTGSKPELTASLDLDEEMPLHQQPKYKSQQTQMHYNGRASPSSPNLSKRLHRLKLARLSHLDNGTKAKISRSVATSHVKTWLHSRGYVVKADKLHPAVARVIEEWFSLVDQDGSRTLEHHELLAALKAAQIPCSDATIHEMIDMMDMNKDGVIGWDEFAVFMTEEFAAGKSLLSGEYLLPSGTSLNFGVMIGKLKRNKLLKDIMEDTHLRNRWATIASNPDQLGRELAVMQEAVEATSITLEHIQRSEAARAAAAGGEGRLALQQQQAQLTAALVKAMEDSRRAARAVEPLRSLTEKLRAGVLSPSPPPELQRRDSLPAAPPPPQPPQSLEQQLLHLASPLAPRPTTSPRVRAPDPTASPPTPSASDGGLSACSSIDPLMQLHMHPSAPVGGGGGATAAAITASGGGHDVETHSAGQPDDCGAAAAAFPSGASKLAVTTSAPSPGIACVPSYNVQAVARYLESQQSMYGTPPPTPPPQPPQPQPQPLLASAGGALLEWWAAPGARAAASATWQYKGSGSGALAPARSLAASSPTPPAHGSRRPSEAPSAAAMGSVPRPRHHPPSSPAGWSEPLPLRPSSRSGSASRLLAAAIGGAGGAVGRRGPGQSSHGGAPEPHYLTAGTASSRAHVRQSNRVMSQVGHMARELRGAPGRYSAEPPGLPAAVLVATRGQWGPLDGGAGGVGGGGGAAAAVSSADRSLRSTADGFAASSRSTSAYGTPGMAAPPLKRRGGSALAAAPSIPAAAAAAAATPLPTLPPPRGSSNSLPALPPTGQFSQFIDSAFAPRKVDPAGSSSPDGVARGVGGRGAASSSGMSEAPLPAHVRTLATAAWEPTSPRDGGDAAAAAVPLSPRASWPASRQHCSAAGDGDAPCGAGCATATATVYLASQADGAGKALKPTSARGRAGLAASADSSNYGCGGGGGSERAGNGGGVAPAVATTDEPARGMWRFSSDDGAGRLSNDGGGGPTSGRRSPPRAASPSGSVGGAVRSGAQRRAGPRPGSPPSLHGGASPWQMWLSAHLPNASGPAAAVSVAAAFAPIPLLDSASFVPAPAVPPAASSDGGRVATADGGAASGRAGSPGRSPLALLGSLEVRPPSWCRPPHGTRAEKEDPAAGDPSWHAAAASLLQLHITQQLGEMDTS